MAVLLALAFALGPPRAARGAGPAVTRPNIVVILSDDQRWDTLGRMKNVERLLAAHGVTFTNAFVTTSVCCPSRATILTGQYSHDTGVLQNFGPASYPAFRDSSTLPVWLSAAGYRDGARRQVPERLSDLRARQHPAGWSKWWAIDSRPETRYYDYILNENGRQVHYGVAPPTTRRPSSAARPRIRAEARRSRSSSTSRRSPRIRPRSRRRRTSRRRSFLPRPRPDFNERDISDKPWHRIYKRVLSPRAVSFLNRSIEGRQLRTLRELDRQVGALVHTLEQRGVLDHTIIVFASDNGFLWGEHRLGGKIWPYEESIRVPLVIRVPWQDGGPRKDAHLVLNLDFASTIAELAGVTPACRRRDAASCRCYTARSPPWRHDFLVEYLGVSQLFNSGPPPSRRCARRAGSTSSTGTAGGSCTTSGTTRTSSEPSRGRRRWRRRGPGSRPGCTRSPARSAASLRFTWKPRGRDAA